MKKTPIYITGHQHPDTDSVASAIAYAFFKRSLGTPAVPCCLGKLNEETRYLLNRFHFQEPQLLTERCCMKPNVLSVRIHLLLQYLESFTLATPHLAYLSIKQTGDGYS